MFSAAMLKLFLQSYGAPKGVVELFESIQSEGFKSFGFKQAPADDPNWTALETDPHKKHVGLYVRAVSPKSRVTIGVFYEGDDDEVLARLESFAARPTLGR